MPISSPVVVALDYPDQAQALAMADQLDPAKVRVKAPPAPPAPDAARP